MILVLLSILTREPKMRTKKRRNDKLVLPTIEEIRRERRHELEQRLDRIYRAVEIRR